MASIKKQEGKNGVSYKITVTSGRDMAGKQIRHYLTWKPDEGMTKRQIEKKVNEIAVEFEKNIDIGFKYDDKQTFSQYAEYCYQIRKRRGDTPVSLHSYDRDIRRINEYIGHMRLGDIRPQHINDIYADLEKPGSNRRAVRVRAIVDFREIADKGITELSRRCGVAITVIQALCAGKTICEDSAKKIEKTLNRKYLFEYLDKDRILSSGTIRSISYTMNTVFEQAEKEMIIPYNPVAKSTPPPKNKNTKKKHMQPDELWRIMDALNSEPIKIRALLTLYAVTGCRRGEIIALKWSKIDLFNHEITIDSSLHYLPETGIYEGETKTGNIRKISITEDIAKMLIEYKIWHDQERIRFGDQWKDSGYVFTNMTGGAIQANYINVIMIDFYKRHNLPHINPHMFRHTVASILISQGTDIQSVASILGHSTVQTTLGVYTHVIDDVKNKASEHMCDIVLRKKA